MDVAAERWLQRSNGGHWNADQAAAEVEALQTSKAAYATNAKNGRCDATPRILPCSRNIHESLNKGIWWNRFFDWELYKQVSLKLITRVGSRRARQARYALETKSF